MIGRRPWLTWVVFATCVVVAAAGLGWATRQSLQTERQRAAAAAEQEAGIASRFVLWRMDSVVAQLLARESSRPYFHYRPFYAEERAYTRMFEEVEPGDVLVPSPLLTAPAVGLDAAGLSISMNTLAPIDANVIRLHFQLEPDGTVTSPQAPGGNMRDLAESSYVPADRVIEAEARRVELAAMIKSARRRAVERAIDDGTITALMDAAPPEPGRSPAPWIAMSNTLPQQSADPSRAVAGRDDRAGRPRGSSRLGSATTPESAALIEYGARQQVADLARGDQALPDGIERQRGGRSAGRAAGNAGAPGTDDGQEPAETPAPGAAPGAGAPANLAAAGSEADDGPSGGGGGGGGSGGGRAAGSRGAFPDAGAAPNRSPRAPRRTDANARDAARAQKEAARRMLEETAAGGSAATRTAGDAEVADGVDDVDDAEGVASAKDAGTAAATAPSKDDRTSDLSATAAAKEKERAAKEVAGHESGAGTSAGTDAESEATERAPSRAAGGPAGGPASGLASGPASGQASDAAAPTKTPARPAGRAGTVTPALAPPPGAPPTSAPSTGGIAWDEAEAGSDVAAAGESFDPLLRVPSLELDAAAADDARAFVAPPRSLEIATDHALADRLPFARVGPLEPAWLRGADGTPHLLLVRTVVLDARVVHQGIWLDWEGLRETLLAAGGPAAAAAELAAWMGDDSEPRFASANEPSDAPAAMPPSTASAVADGTPPDPAAAPAPATPTAGGPDAPGRRRAGGAPPAPRPSADDLERAARALPARAFLDDGRTGTTGPDDLLATLPIRVLLPTRPAVTVRGWTVLRGAFVVAWVSLLAAIVAIGLVLRAAIALGERRVHFVSAVTHELRTPLTTFQLYSQMLAQGMVRREEDRQQYLETLERESERLGRIVENVLAYARLGRRGGRRWGQARDGRNGSGTSDAADPATTITVEDALDRMRRGLAERVQRGGGTLHERVAPDARTARLAMPVEAIEQILVNLVDNACKHGPADGTVELDVRAAGRGRVTWSIRDHGRGVPPSDVGALFHAFRQGRTTEASGLGLGLSLSRDLARESGGDLTYEPPRDGGACFVLTVPVVDGGRTRIGAVLK